MDVERILSALDVPLERAQELLALAKLANIEFQNDRQALMRGIAYRHDDLAAMEQKSTELRYVLPVMLTGLLQTSEYLRHTAGGVLGGRSDRDRETAVARRIKRQEILLREDKKFVFLLTEAAVRCRMISASGMVKQLDLLIALDQRSNVDIEVTPLGRHVPWVPLNVFVV